MTRLGFQFFFLKQNKLSRYTEMGTTFIIKLMMYKSQEFLSFDGQQKLTSSSLKYDYGRQM